MKVGQYVGFLVKDFLLACSCVLIVVLLALPLGSVEVVRASSLWQIVFAGAIYALVKNAFIETHELGRRAQIVSFFVCSTLANIIGVFWLWRFAPGTMSGGLALGLLIAILIVKGGTYAMMHADGRREAKQVNERLQAYRRGGEE